MHWHIRSHGSRAVVRNEVIACFDMPAGVRSTVLEILDDPKAAARGNDSAFVEGAGATGDGCGYIQTLRVLLFTAARPVRRMHEVLP